MKEYQQLQLISPKEFKERFASALSVPTVRDLFHRGDFPAVQIGVRLYTTEKAAEKWLANLGRDGGEE